MFASDETQPPSPGVELAPLKWDFTCARRARAPWHALVGELWGRKHLEVSPVCALPLSVWWPLPLCLAVSRPPGEHRQPREDGAHHEGVPHPQQSVGACVQPLQ